MNGPSSLNVKARSLRNSPTLPEQRLWQQLRKRRLAGLKFQRQYVIETFIVDFVCLEKRLVIELDGPYHRQQLDQDQQRDALLRERGFRVVRFDNDAVEDRLNEVLAKIEYFAFGRTC